MQGSATLPELDELERVIAGAQGRISTRIVCEIADGDRQFPVHAVSLGNPDPGVPGVGYFGGVHGLERIGAEVVIAFLRSVVERLHWDRLLQRQLEGMRMVFMPIVNPGGMWRGTRANPSGVDLMRNAPVEAVEGAPFLLGGQRYSPGLPWFRGRPDEAMQPEARALCEVVSTELIGRPFALALDCHSGFGVSDRIWFPFAHTRAPVEHLAEIHALKAVFDRAHPHHHYLFEPQSRHYLAHGDLWDHLVLQARNGVTGTFVPLTLEMGSWLWVKKNPRQLLSRQGIFNPLIRHRQRRVLRRHLAWCDFAARAAYSHAGWLPVGDARALHLRAARTLWYPTLAATGEAAAAAPAT